MALGPELARQLNPPHSWTFDVQALRLTDTSLSGDNAPRDPELTLSFSASIEKTAATTSHHLKLLRDVGLVATEKRGTWVFYRVVPERLAAVRDALAFTC